MDTTNRELLDFIEHSPTAWHAAANIARELEAAGYTRLHEERDWRLEAPGKYYVVRNGSSLIALDLPAEADGEEDGFSGFSLPLSFDGDA